MTEKKSQSRTVFLFGLLGIGLSFLLFFVYARFWLPALIGVMMAMSCHPLKVWFEKKVFKRKNSAVASSLTCVVLIATTVLPIIAAGTVIASELLNILREAPAIVSEYGDLILPKINGFLTGFGFQGISNSGAKIKAFIVERSGGTLESLSTITLVQAGFWGEFLLATVVAFLVMYFCLVDAQKIKIILVRKFYLREVNLLSFTHRMQSSIKSIMLGILAAAVTQSIVMGLAFYFAGLPGAKLSAAATFIFAFIPLLGSWPMAIVGFAITLIHADYKGFFVVVVFGIIAGICDNFAKVWISGEDEEAHSLLVFMSILGGLELMGASGLIFGPLALNMFIEVSDQILPTLKMLYDYSRARLNSRNVDRLDTGFPVRSAQRTQRRLDRNILRKS